MRKIERALRAEQLGLSQFVYMRVCILISPALGPLHVVSPTKIYHLPARLPASIRNPISAVRI